MARHRARPVHPWPLRGQVVASWLGLLGLSCMLGVLLNTAWLWTSAALLLSALVVLARSVE